MNNNMLDLKVEKIGTKGARTWFIRKGDEILFKKRAGKPNYLAIILVKAGDKNVVLKFFEHAADVALFLFWDKLRARPDFVGLAVNAAHIHVHSKRLQVAIGIMNKGDNLVKPDHYEPKVLKGTLELQVYALRDKEGNTWTTASTVAVSGTVEVYDVKDAAGEFIHEKVDKFFFVIWAISQGLQYVEETIAIKFGYKTELKALEARLSPLQWLEALGFKTVSIHPATASSDSDEEILQYKDNPEIYIKIVSCGWVYGKIDLATSPPRTIQKTAALLYMAWPDTFLGLLNDVAKGY